MCVKRERSPTPPLSSKRLVASGSVRVTDMPISCKRGQPGYEHERRVWVKSETQKLRDIGLSVAKVHVRFAQHHISPVRYPADTKLEGVMASQWTGVIHFLSCSHSIGSLTLSDRTSSVPVWSDTLLPLSGDISNDPNIDTAQPPTEVTPQHIGVDIVASDFPSGPEVRSTTTEDSLDAVNRADELEDAALEYIQR